MEDWRRWRLLEEALEAEGAGWSASSEHCLRVLHELVDELVVVCVMEAKMVAPLSAREWEESERLIGRLPPSTPVVSAFNLELQASHLRCLGRLQWLNDEVINFYLQLLQQRQDTPQSLTHHTHNTTHTLRVDTP